MRNIIITDQTPLTKFILAKVIPNTVHFNILEINLETDKKKFYLKIKIIITIILIHIKKF